MSATTFIEAGTTKKSYSIPRPFKSFMKIKTRSTLTFPYRATATMTAAVGATYALTMP